MMQDEGLGKVEPAVASKSLETPVPVLRAQVST